MDLATWTAAASADFALQKANLLRSVGNLCTRSWALFLAFQRGARDFLVAVFVWYEQWRSGVDPQKGWEMVVDKRGATFLLLEMASHTKAYIKREVVAVGEGLVSPTINGSLLSMIRNKEMVDL
eukprot:1353307-Ditylum_brightwellii.AAC.2